MNLFYKCILSMLTFFLLGILLEYNIIFFFNKNFQQLIFPNLYKNEFSEKSFSCHPELFPDYQKMVDKGYQIMRTKKIAIAGIARDTESVLFQTIYKIEAIGKLFNQYHVVVFENDSKDKTRAILKEWQYQNNNVTLLECDGVTDCKLNQIKMYDLGPRSFNRIEKMAFFRNNYLNYIKKFYTDFDYLLVVDFDLQGPWSHDGIAHSIAQEDWDGIFAYGLHSLIGSFGFIYMMYDGLAYVGKDSQYDSPKRLFRNYFKMNFIDLYGAAKCNPLVPVKSSFSGMALYQLKSVLGAEYNSKWPCEHIGLHELMAQKGYGKFFINPSLILLSGHQGPQNLFKMIW
ncbi:MAG: hypothetical protein EBU90_14545 [Proteobacteria bacterium]|nr:hypothetical protein [Pseudomonadota bacterium]NBP15193.1 hypothetical protein [bacterium]